MICDLAETYNIYDYRELSPDRVAVLVFGLRDDSRVKMHLSNNSITLEQTLMAMLVDGIKFIAWTYSKDAHKGRAYNEKSVLKTLRGEYKNENDDLMTFASPEEFQMYWQSINED